MALYFATLTLLIIAVLGIRAVFKRTVSPRLIYALWIAAVIRLCLPISLFEADFLTVFAEHDESVPAEVILPADEADGNEKTEENEAIILETAVPETEYVMPEGYAPAVTMPAPAVPGPVPQLPEMPEYSVPETEIPAEIIEEPEVSETPDEADSRDYANEIRRILILVWIGGAALMALWFTG